MLCVVMKVFSHVSAKTKTEKLQSFKFRTFIGRFQAISWQRRGNSFYVATLHAQGGVGVGVT